jgi:hypothetical protein
MGRVGELVKQVFREDYGVQDLPSCFACGKT